MNMYEFDPDLSISENHGEAFDLDYAAWVYAGHDHREAFRDCGPDTQKTAYLRHIRTLDLKEAIASNELIAIGILKKDPQHQHVVISSNFFKSGSTVLNLDNSSANGLGHEYLEIRICGNSVRAATKNPPPAPIGRPNCLQMLRDAWQSLKDENPNFLGESKKNQNSYLSEEVARLFPTKFPGNARVGESTIRKHRRENPDLFK